MNTSSDVRYLEIGLSAAAFLNVIDHGGPLRLVPKGKFSLSEKKVEAAPSFSLTASLIVFGLWSVLDFADKEKRIRKKSGNNVNVQTWYYCSHI